MSDAKRVIGRGIIAGLIGATAMALWFLVVDGSQGVPLRTPAFLAGALLGQEGLEFGPGALFAATLVHYSGFVLVGIGLTWVCAQIVSTPNTLLGLAVGFLLFDVVFYASVYATGVDIVAALGWPAVLVGNLIAGISMTGFLRATGTTRPIPWWERFSQQRVLREGVMTGLIGAGIVAAWFLIFDLSRGEPLFTPGALGSALFFGASDMAAIQITPLTVGGYTAAHVLAFVAAGMVASVVLTEAETKPPMLFGAFMLFIIFEAFFMGVMALVAEFLLGPLAWWTILVGNLVATAAMGAYLWKEHPQLAATLDRDAAQVVG